MADQTLPVQQPEFLAAYREDESKVRIRTGKLACVLVIVLMPAGVLLDLTVYPEKTGEFLLLRLLCSLLVCGVWALHFTRFARRHYPWVGATIPLLPVLFMTWMIFDTEGPLSPYYAGLNLVLLALSAVGHWSLRESITAVSLVLATYMLAISLYMRERSADYLASARAPTEAAQPLRPGSPSQQQDGAWAMKDATENLRLFFSNLYFLALTGIIVVAGNTIFTRLRLREFSLRFELDQSRRELEENHQKLLELDQAKSHFFANISHELRTPLTLLLAPLESLLHKTEPGQDAGARDMLLTMQANGMRLLKLINDLLDLVRLESGRMEVRREAVDLASFLQGLVNAARGVAEGKGVVLSARMSPDLGSSQLDRDKLEKILLNLVFNALKFTESGGSVTLQASHENDHLVLAVQDTGMGIPHRQLPHVFSRFWQADSSARRKHQGAGIGLALVKELTEIQGGTVTADSTEGRGATFTIRLPWITPESTPDQEEMRPKPTSSTSKQWLENLYRRAELFPAIATAREQQRVEPAPTGSGPRRRILIADDEPEMLRFLRTELARYYEIDEATDGRQALERALATPPDLILLDMMMPEMDGLQACRELRERASTRAVPVVLLTARADEETKLATLSAGANDFLTKPFSTTELEVRVRNLVQNHLLQQELARQNALLESTIEQLKETEVQLVQAEKLASLGRLSAGIIHEINNPLNFATTNLYSLRRSSDSAPEALRHEMADTLNDMEEGLRRVRDIVTNLRSFTHPGGGIVENIELRGIVEAALRFLSHELREQVQLDNQIPDQLTVHADRNRFLQVLINLLQNAVDAVRLRSDSSQPGRIWLFGRCEDQKVALIIRDNGPGIDPAIRDKVFDPFFTTKDIGQGLGLGLSISYRIIEQLGGRLTLRSDPGQPTEMEVRLPAGTPDHPHPPET